MLSCDVRGADCAALLRKQRRCVCGAFCSSPGARLARPNLLRNGRRRQDGSAVSFALRALGLIG